MASLGFFRFLHRSNSLSRKHWPSILRPPNHFSNNIFSREAWNLQIVSSRLRSFNTPSRRWSQATTQSSTPFTYAISAAYSGKHDPLNLTTNIYTYDPNIQPITNI